MVLAAIKMALNEAHSKVQTETQHLKRRTMRQNAISVAKIQKSRKCTKIFFDTGFISVTLYF